MTSTLERLNERRRQDEGFTLIELLVVIVILGILAAVVVFAVGGITDRGEESACDASSKSIEVASEAYYAENGSYATTIAVLETEGLLRIDDDLTLGGGDLTLTTPGGTVTYTPGTGAVTDNCA